MIALLVSMLVTYLGYIWLKSGAAADGGPLGGCLALLMIVGGGATTIGLFLSRIF